ncbi:hypothetical protein [Actinotalea sp. C106]|uniref:TY-Chap domain-containing protein n=1 Tax=Actinotalea sp. C106 TaxID=2908644 RepID=UPI0020284D59|nr:hypothetical protein [Actinotalea sp. C106]
MPTPTSPAPWSAVEQELATTLRSLEEGESVVVEVTGAGRPAVLQERRLLGLVRERTGTVHPYTQAIRVDDALVAECAGSPRTGGVYPWTPEEEERILALGWLVPDRPDFVVPGYQREWVAGPGLGYAEATHTSEAAALMVRTLREVMACTDPADVRVQVNRS